MYYDELIRPLIERAKNEPEAYELAFAACVTVFHFADVYAAEHGITVEEARSSIEHANAEFHVLAAVANAVKHGKITRASYGQLSGLRAQDAKRVSINIFEGMGWTELENVEPYTTVIMELPDGSSVHLLSLCHSVADTMGEHFIAMRAR